MNRRFARIMEDLRGLAAQRPAPSDVYDADRELSGNRMKILLALSGGIDSMCMADLFNQLEKPMNFAVAHCNFHLRGEESDGDQVLVSEWAANNGVKLHTSDFDTVGHAAKKGISIEMAARELRYNWFAELCSQYGYTAVAVAHNANDNAETLILNLLRGSGIKGLAGMSQISELPVKAAERPLLLRPLLSFSRKQIEGYMFSRKLTYREDSSNASSEYKRNRIRNEVFPICEAINPSLIKTLNREMGYFAEVSEIVGDYCKDLLPSIVSSSEDCVTIDLKALTAQIHWKYILYHILEPYGFNSSTLASVEALLLSNRTISGKTFTSADYIINTERDSLVLRAGNALKRNDVVMPIRTAGTYHFNGCTIKVEVLEWSSDMPVKQPKGILIADAAELKFPFVLRGWRDGDWLIPLGMRGRKKVSDLFTDLKFNSQQKHSAVIIADSHTLDSTESQHIAAVAGFRLDSRYKITPSTISVIKISSSI